MYNENEERLALANVPEPFENAFAVLGDTVRAFADKMAEIVKPIIKVIKTVANAFVETAIFAYMAGSYSKWWHYYKHAKRRRIRKKYRDKLVREMIKMIEKGVL